MGAAPDPPPDKPQDGAAPPEGRQGPQPTSGGGASGGHRRPTLPSLPGPFALRISTLSVLRTLLCTLAYLLLDACSAAATPALHPTWALCTFVLQVS